MVSRYFTPLPSESVVGSERYSPLLTKSKIQYPLGNSGFIEPYIQFVAHSPDGDAYNSVPRTSLPLPEQFRTSHQNNYQESQYIFPGQTIFSAIKNAVGKSNSDSANNASGNSNAQQSGQLSAANAFEYMLLKGGDTFSGFINSGGMSGIDQFEFYNKKVVNNMQQLLYKGPVYRNFEIPILMRPQSEDEAKEILAAVSFFKMAAATSPLDGLDIDAGAVLGTDTGEGTFDSLASVPYTFTYPDLLQFNIFVSNPNQDGVSGISGNYQRVFTSRLCAIIDLNVQYGSNRINFVKSDGGSVSYPSEVAISLALKEVEFNTSHEAIQEASDSNRTIR